MHLHCSGETCKLKCVAQTWHILLFMIIICLSIFDIVSVSTSSIEAAWRQGVDFNWCSNSTCLLSSYPLKWKRNHTINTNEYSLSTSVLNIFSKLTNTLALNSVKGHNTPIILWLLHFMGFTDALFDILFLLHFSLK